MRSITQQDIYRAWLGDIIIGPLYNSPIPGRNDRTPSFGLYVKDGQILWCDHGLANQFGDKPENLVQHMEGLELTPKGFYDARRLITKRLNVPSVVALPLVQLRQRPKRQTTPYIKERGYKDFELDYWARFDIDEKELLNENIHPLESMSWSGEGGKAHVVSTPSNPAFVYWWNRNPASWKMYRPLGDKRDKFRQDNIKGVIEGWHSMMATHELSSKGKFDIMFVLSSTKDRLVVKHAFGNHIYYNGINPKGESDYQDIVAHRDEIKAIADRVIILYDADDAGQKGSERLGLLTGFEYYPIPKGFLGKHYNPNHDEMVNTKDFSDYVDIQRGGNSYESLLNLINNLIS